MASSATAISTQEQAIKITKAWLAIRLEVRRYLIDAAKARHPAAEVGEEWESNAVRKLYQYPNDLSEQRLIYLIEDK